MRKSQLRHWWRETKKDLVLKVACVSIKSLIEDFIKEDAFYKYLQTPDDFYGKCDGVSNDFYNYLSNKGIKASIIHGVGYFKTLDKNAAKNALKIDPKYLTHVVVQVGNTIVDLTGKQFGYTPISIKPFSSFKKEWKTIKKGPYWKR